MYVNCFPLHFCCLQLVTKAMLLYNSAICDLLRESIQIMKILIHLKVVILVSEKWNEHNLMYIDHKQCEIMQKIQWNSSKANFANFPLTDGAAVEQQCLCKWLQKIDKKGNRFQHTNQLENKDSWRFWINLGLIRWYTKGEKVAKNLKIVHV